MSTKSRKGQVLIFAGLLCSYNISFADIYKYVDKEGVLHLTPNPSEPDTKYVLIMKEKRIIKEKSITKEEKKAKQKKAEQSKKDRIANLKKKHPDWSDKTIMHISNRNVYLGMNKEQAIASWGKPYDIHKTTTINGVHEQWFYSVHNYLYFDDGILTSFQN